MNCASTSLRAGSHAGRNMCNTLMVSSRKRQEEMRPGPVWQGEGLRMKAASGVLAAKHYGRLDFAMHVQPRTTTPAQVASAP